MRSNSSSRDGVAVEARGDVGIGEFATAARAHRAVSESTGPTTSQAPDWEQWSPNLEVGMGRIVVETDNDRLFDGEEFIGDRRPSATWWSTSTRPKALEDSYITSEGDITLDLDGLVLTEDRVIEVASDFGNHHHHPAGRHLIPGRSTHRLRSGRPVRRGPGRPGRSWSGRTRSRAEAR